jgi:DNA-binding MurR/RpiR family transcriptional regulator
MPDSEGAAPQTFDELVGTLQRNFGALTPAQKLLAERVMSDPEGTAFMTITELAAAVGVNEATVVRFAASLGLDGYPGLARLCRERLREQAQLLRRFGNLEQLGSDGRDPLDLAIVFDQANIARTFSRIDRLSWNGAVEALATAPAVHVVGLRKCYAPAFLLGYLLRLVRNDVSVLTPGVGTLTDDLRQLRPEDCFVGIAIHRYTADTVRAFRWAQRVGATTIALTDNPSSPLAIRATHTFYIDTAGVAVLRSVTAFTSLVQALVTAVAAQRAEARSALLVEEELLESFGTYTADESSPPSQTAAQAAAKQAAAKRPVGMRATKQAADRAKGAGRASARPADRHTR